MNFPNFPSVLAEPLATFVQYQQALNRKYRTESAALHLFDRYLSEPHVASWESIDPLLIDDFLKSPPRTRPRSYNHLVGVLHRFFAWTVVQRLRRCNPVSVKLGRETAPRMPYLFNLNRVEACRSAPGWPRVSFAPLNNVTAKSVNPMLRYSPSQNEAAWVREPLARRFISSYPS